MWGGWACTSGGGCRRPCGSCGLVGDTKHIAALGADTEYRTEFTPNEADFRERIHPKKDFRLEDPEFSPKPYYQVFQEKHGFLPNLSIVDLLFNMGPESLLML